MSNSTVSGPFRSENGFQQLVNGVWTPIELVTRVVSTASASSLTPNISVADMYAYTALAANLTINVPIGSYSDGSRLMFRILDNGVSRTLTWNGIYTAIGVTLPGSTTASKTTYVGCIYNSANNRWDVIAVTTEA